MAYLPLRTRIRYLKSDFKINSLKAPELEQDRLDLNSDFAVSQLFGPWQIASASGTSVLPPVKWI